MASISGDIMHIAASSCLPQSPSFSLPSSLTKTLRQYFLNKPSFIAFPSLALCISKQTQVWVTQIHFLCPKEMIFPGRGEHELPTSAETTIQAMSCFLQNQYQNFPDIRWTKTWHCAKAQFPSQTFKSLNFCFSIIQKSWSQLLPYKVPYLAFAINCLKQLWQLRKRVILIVFSTHNLTIRCLLD